MNTSASLSFQSTKVVPDLITVAPQSFLTVKYNNKNMNFGQELTPTQVKDPPAVTWDFKELGYYTVTLCMADLDGRLPGVATPVQALHWLVTNIPGNNVSKGETLTEYIGSGPPKDSGLHRYVSLLYKQPGMIQFDEKRIDKRTVDGRIHFSIQKFAEKCGLGDPVAGNMYHAQYDDYVPVLHAQLSHS